ncbi:MAG: ADP-forming succinate--CoA ligase subunit beta [Candidatus Marinimicrobia bacterium]|nr:ADP-forming succinate--CoA ligase subunit beta [Candidatus Neomarinimicrobiota bacterium]
MKIHEYQGKDIFKSNGVPTPNGKVAFSSKEAVEVAKKIGGNKWVVKAQIHAGGRGKGGGIKIANSLEEVENFSKMLLGNKLITHQTGPEGKEVNRLLIEEGINIKREIYASIVLDRSVEKFVFMVSTEGGIDIEQTAANSPEKILKIWVHPYQGLTPFLCRQLCYNLGFVENEIKNGIKMFKALWNTFVKYDCSLLEINPLVVTSNQEIIALDSKINFDDNSLFRQQEIEKLRDFSEELPIETEAAKNNLNYIKLDGNVGCMVNGAGLAMATMDIIKIAGGEPANFLDVGGVANTVTISKGFKLILSDNNVKSILINIFGGIVRCDRVAKGVIKAIKDLNIKIPIVVRLEGTNSMEASKLLKDSSLDFIVANNLADAAEKAVMEAKR